jgi:hypothetical protein
MIHDRASFGGSLIAIGILYWWLIEFPLRHGQPWAWWVLAASGTFGFASFLACLGYGYLDTWHGAATLLILPCYTAGLVRSWRSLSQAVSRRSLLQPADWVSGRTPVRFGRLLILGVAVALTLGGLVILVIGTAWVFVPQDVGYLGLCREELDMINPRLVPLIAHDRAAFGAAVACFGLTSFFSVWCSVPCRSLWQALASAGTVGFALAIGVHPAIGYNDPIHLGPAVLGALVFAVGMVLTCREMWHTPHSGLVEIRTNKV